MDTNTIIEGTVKFRDGKKWKSRWCVVRKLSPVADCVHLQLYRDCKERYKQGQTKASLSLENFLGIQSGFTLDKESNTLAIICQELIVVLAFDTREHLMQWQVKITTNLGEGDQWLVQICSAPAKAKVPAGPARLLLQEYQFCLTVGVPPRLINFWQISQLRRFGVVEGKFCFEGGSRCGRGEGLYILVSEKPEDLARAFYLAADGKLFTNKRPLSRNSSVMDKTRKHHTLRPDSRLSNGSSLESTLESPAGCDGSQSREDLLSWCQHAFPDLGDTVSNSESAHRFDLKSLWTADTPMARCASCMSKLGSMSRSSTLTHTPGSGFPAWTMDRPKSCGSQKMSCSSVSLSSHSSRGSSCGQRLSAAVGPSESCHPLCSANGNMCPCSVKDHSLSPPVRPPKPPHLSFLRLQSTPSPSTSDCPSPLSSLNLPLSPSPSPSCCCGHQGAALSPFGNYDVPKPLNVQRRLKLNSPMKTISQSSSDEYYDTPRKLKDSLIWEYGNYDIPPPAQPVSPASHMTRLSLDPTEISPDCRELELSSDEKLPFQINKVKLTGQGKMPVMSPCGKIIEKPEPSYEEKLDQLLENENLSLDVSSSNYMNVKDIENNNSDSENNAGENISNNNSSETDQNYSNISVIQSLQNYENFLCFFSEKTSKMESLDQSTICSEMEKSSENKESKTLDTSVENSSLCCSNCGHVCSKTGVHTPVADRLAYQQTCRNSNDQLKSENKHPSGFLSNKYNSTSCLHEENLDTQYCCEKSTSEDKILRSKSLLKCSVSASNSPQLRRPPVKTTAEAALCPKLHKLSLRKRSNSADSARFPMDDESVDDTASTDAPGKSCLLSNPSSSDSLCVVDKLDSPCRRKDVIVNKCELKLAPLVITENIDLLETSSEKCSKRCARRSSSVPNKFFSNRDSSSSNDSGVSTGSLSLKHFGAEFLEFEMPLTTSMSSKRHHIAMLNNNSDVLKPKTLPKRSKSVDPLRELTFTFDDSIHQSAKSTSAEAEVPVFLNAGGEKDYLSPLRTTTYLHDSRSTSSATSDISDYIETLSYSSYSSLDPPENLRNGKAMALTMKPRSGKEYQQIDRNLLDKVAKS